MKLKNLRSLVLLTLSCGQIAAHDPRVIAPEQPLSESPSSTETTTAELPKAVLSKLLVKLGLTCENGHPLIGIEKLDHKIMHELLSYVNSPIATLTDADNNILTCQRVTFSPDGQHMAVRDLDNLYHLFTHKGQSISLTDAEDNKLTCKYITFSPDGQLIAVQDTDYYYHLFTLDGESITLADANGSSLACWDILFSPDGQHIVARDTKSHRHLFTGDGQYIRALTDAEGNNLTSRGITFSPDGQFIEGPGTNDRLYTRDGQHITLTTAAGNKLTCWDITFSPDGQLIAAQDTKNFHYHLFTRDGLHISLTLPGRNNTFSPDGERIAVWDINNACHVMSLSMHYPFMSELQRGIWPSQLLMLELLATLKTRWQQEHPGRPYKTCPAKITCVLLELAAAEFVATDEEGQKALAAQTYEWVVRALNEFKNIVLPDGTSYHDLLCNMYNIEDDPVIRHEDHEEKGPIVAPYFLPYIRIKNLTKKKTAATKIQALWRGYSARKNN